MADLALRIAARYLHAGYLNVGDYVWAGKYKNKLAIVTAFGQDEKGNPTITISPIPKGRKQDKTFSLFKVWKVRPEQIAELKAKGKIAKTAAQEADRQRLIAEDLAMEAEFARQERERLAQPVVYDPANTKLEHAPMARRLALRVKLAARPKLPTLWYENEAGDRWEVSPTDPYVEPPEGFIYQHSRFPHVLRETVLRMVQQSEVDACDHPADMMKPDLGLIEGLEGRECLKCHGTQVKDAGAPWPAQWEAYGSREILTGESTWPDELVLAMVRPSPAEMVLALERHGSEPRLLGMNDAIILAATSCERCLNGLLWRYGCNDGYPPYSEQWNKTNTKCAICETPGVWDWLLNEKPMTQRTRQTLQAGEHYTELCRKCGTVMGQCRCASPNKVTVYGLCDACNPQAMEANGPVDWQTVEITSRLAGRVADRYLETKLSPHQRGWEKRKEKDDFTEQNIPPEHLALWRKLKNQFKGTPHERAEAFMEYVEEHPGESDAWLQQNADKEIAKLQREQEKERREQVKLERECEKNQDKYESAWYAEQERQTREKAKLKQLKEKADSVCKVCPSCHQYGPDEPREMVPFAASVAARFAARPEDQEHHIVIRSRGEAITAIKRLGDVGHSTSVDIDGEPVAGVDGDGSDRIEEIIVDDQPLEKMANRIAARYKKKHHIKTEEGKDAVVYEYSENQVARRNAEKAKRLEGLRKNIGNLRAKVKRDLRSSDPEKALTALAVALIDHTYERVGNDGSAKERGHYGVTGWQKSHVSFGRGKATVKYVGKSGVEQKKTVSDKAILTALRNAYEACADDDGCLFEHATGKIGADKVNAYLEAFDVSAKDLRGFHANREMQERLSAIRGKGGSLPEDKKERKAKLKEEFKKALEETAEAVGHEPSTLRSQYLVPGLEDQFMKDGTVSKAMKIASYDEDDYDRR